MKGEACLEKDMFYNTIMKNTLVEYHEFNFNIITILCLVKY